MTQLENYQKERERLLDNLDLIVNKAIVEQRNLTVDEEAKVKCYQDLIDDYDHKIKVNKNHVGLFTKELRQYTKNTKNVTLKGNDTMKNNEFLRELRNAKEVNIADMQLRAVGTNHSTSASSKVQVAENLVDGIVTEAQKTNEIFSKAKLILTSNDTRLNIGAYGETTMQELEEFGEIQMKDFEVSQVVVPLKRYGHGSRISRRLINSSNFDVFAHAYQVFGDVLGRQCEKLAVAALEQAVTATKIAKVEVGEGANYTRAVAQAILKLKPVYRANAAIICSPAAYEELMLAEDSNGRNLLTFELTSIRASFMGVPILVSDGIEDGAYVIDVERALVACINIDTVKAVDEPSVDAVDLYLNTYIGCGVQLPAAAVKIVPAPTRKK